ncbi:MAG: TolB-like 6-bladed beta-propeller domain-containing protein [Dysgonamonadaceae bacterium]|jgi:hypothetical protein|nr:TolB-like 6-bladed beta-propeller domain-containing protein [Dysgonamonadaceae bacterium]
MMRNKTDKIVCLLVLILLFQGCKNKEEKRIEFDNQIRVQADSIKIDIPISVRGWKVGEDKISIQSGNNSDYCLYVFSVPDMNLLYRYGTYGQGPGEFIAVNWLNATGEGQIGLYDIPNLKMYMYQLFPDTLHRIKTYHFNPWDGKLCRPYSSIQQINDSIFLLKAHMWENTEIEVANIHTGAILNTFGPLLQREPNTLYTPFYFGMAGNDQNLVLYYEYINRLELFEYNETAYTFNPIAAIGNDKDQSGIDVFDYILHYSDAQCDKEYIYALYQGERRENIRNSTIEVYNWRGEPVKRIILDRFIEKMAIDVDHGKIYGCAGHQDFDYVYVYDIK